MFRGGTWRGERVPAGSCGGTGNAGRMTWAEGLRNRGFGISWMPRATVNICTDYDGECGA